MRAFEQRAKMRGMLESELNCHGFEGLAGFQHALGKIHPLFQQPLLRRPAEPLLEIAPKLPRSDSVACRQLVGTIVGKIGGQLRMIEPRQILLNPDSAPRCPAGRRVLEGHGSFPSTAGAIWPIATFGFAASRRAQPSHDTPMQENSLWRQTRFYDVFCETAAFDQHDSLVSERHFWSIRDITDQCVG